MRKFLVILAGLFVGLSVWLAWPKSGGALVLYSAIDYGPSVARAFTRKTGIKVRVVTSSTGQLLARIAAEGSRPSWDIAWFDGAIAASSLNKEGLLEKIPVKPDLFNGEGKALLPVDRKWVPTGYTLSGVFVYRRAGVHPPAGYSGLLQEKYRGVIGMNNPSISGPTFPLVAAMLKEHGGWSSGKTYLEKLATDGLHVFAKNKYTLQALKEHKIGIAMVQSSAGYALENKDPEIYGVKIPRDAYILPRVIVASKGLSREKMKLVLEFVRYALGAEATRRSMQHGHSDGYFWPVSSGFRLEKKGLPLVAKSHLETLDPVQWGGLEASINNWFNTRIVNQ